MNYYKSYFILLFFFTMGAMEKPILKDAIIFAQKSGCSRAQSLNVAMINNPSEYSKLRRLILSCYHPDKHSGKDSDVWTVLFQDVNLAFDALMGDGDAQSQMNNNKVRDIISNFKKLGYISSFQMQPVPVSPVVQLKREQADRDEIIRQAQKKAREDWNAYSEYMKKLKPFMNNMKLAVNKYFSAPSADMREALCLRKGNFIKYLIEKKFETHGAYSDVHFQEIRDKAEEVMGIYNKVCASSPASSTVSLTKILPTEKARFDKLFEKYTSLLNMIILIEKKRS